MHAMTVTTTRNEQLAHRVGGKKDRQRTHYEHPGIAHHVQTNKTWQKSQDEGDCKKGKERGQQETKKQSKEQV